MVTLPGTTCPGIAGPSPTPRRALCSAPTTSRLRATSCTCARPPAAPSAHTPLRYAPALAASRKIELPSVVDVTAEADIVPLPPDSVADAFRRYRDTRGEYPHP